MRTIILFARAPQRGHIKTRLARDIGEQAALGLYVAMLGDSMVKAARVAAMVAGEAVLAFTPRNAMDLEAGDGAPSLRELWRGSSWPQPEGDLGARMHAAIKWGFERGSQAVAVLGSDVPDMDAGNLGIGFGWLRRGWIAQNTDVLLGPSRDGGFWTLMCSRALPRSAFELDWNQDETCAPLQANLERHGLRVKRWLDKADDVDDFEALCRLNARLRKYPASAPRTSLWMQQNGWW